MDDLEKLRLEELEDDLGHTTAENSELRMKMKDLTIINTKLQIRIAELTQIVQEYAPSNNQNENSQNIIEKVINLTEENK